MELSYYLYELIITVLIFLILFSVGRIIYKSLKNSDSMFLDPKEYLPEDEITTLKQVYYLVMMFIFFIFLLYTFIIEDGDLASLTYLEILISLYVLITIDYDSWKHKAIFLLMIPYGSICYNVFGNSPILYLDILHVISYTYMMKFFYGKFRTYTETNSLGITIVLLFVLIALSFINTLIVEHQGPLNAIVMVSNAFTSNGYAILGSSSLGKLNSLVLVWGGYILSGAGTATLTAAILIKHFNKKFDALEDMIKENKK